VFDSDTDTDASNTWRVLHDLDLDSVTSSDDVAVLRYLCSALSIRAAQIVSASVYLSCTRWTVGTERHELIVFQFCGSRLNCGNGYIRCQRCQFIL